MRVTLDDPERAMVHPEEGERVIFWGTPECRRPDDESVTYIWDVGVDAPLRELVVRPPPIVGGLFITLFDRSLTKLLS